MSDLDSVSSEWVAFNNIDPDYLTDDELERYHQLRVEIARAEEAEWTLSPRQQLAYDLADEVDELFYGGAAGGGKCLALDTRIPTPDGWTTMGDIRVGDHVYAVDGTRTTVVAKSPVHVDHDCYRVTFDDGHTVVADADHKWAASDYLARARHNRRGQPLQRSVVTTEQMANSLKHRGRTNWTIELAGAPDNPDADLPIDPYVLGAWLGDGASAHMGIYSADPEVIDEIRLAGFEVRKWASDPYGYGIQGLNPLLDELNVRRNKHIPARYLRASQKQRLALLQGLMDTGGTINQNGSAEFSVTNERLALDTHELILSLGHKAAIRKSPAVLEGRQCGWRWRIKWMSPDPPCRLPRKLDRWTPPTRKVQHRYVVSIEHVSTVPVQCIGVDHPSHLFLIDGFIPTHNTELALYRAYRKSIEIPHHRTLILRRSHPELRRTWVPRSRQRYIERDGVTCRWRAADKEWHFSNGSIIEFGYVDGDRTVRQYDSAEYQMVIIDEASEFTEFEIRFLVGRLRATVSLKRAGARPHVLLLSNPGGIGHMYLRRTYVVPTQYGRVRAKLQMIEGDADSNRTVAFVPAKVDDNPHLDEDYTRNLKQLPEKLRRQRLDGDWDTFDGQFFSEFSAQTHVVEPFDIPKEWPRIRAFDYGYADPAVCLWIAFGWDGDPVVYREWSATRTPPSEQARQIREATGDETIAFSVADPSIWRSLTRKKSIAGQFKTAGIKFKKGDNERVAGWSLIREMLRPRTADDDPELAGIPRLTIVSSCQTLIRTLPEAIHDRKNSDDLRLVDDHWLDALRYGLMSNPRAAVRPQEKAPLPEDPSSARIVQRLRRMGDDGRTGYSHPDLGAFR